MHRPNQKTKKDETNTDTYSDNRTCSKFCKRTTDIGHNRLRNHHRCRIDDAIISDEMVHIKPMLTPTFNPDTI